MQTLPGKTFPLGATWDGHGVNFALYSENAARAELCLFDSPAAAAEAHRLPMHRTGSTWHVYLLGAQPGCLYGYRVHGPYDPDRGHRFNSAKVLLDPYARAAGRLPRWDNSLFGYCIGTPEENLAANKNDSAAYAPLGMVVDGSFDWRGDRPLHTPWENTVIYETHVKGMTIAHPEVPEPLRGTYGGLASPPVIRHLTGLGVTAVELLPIQAHFGEHHLAGKGLSNYWGYNTLFFFAPDPRFAARPENAVTEFKEMVRALHAAGIEVILDVVYNHTPEGNHHGPTLSLRGIDNSVYYRLLADRPRYYMDYTGCGNTLNTPHPQTLQLVMDSLYYWVTEMRVDGFRFDLASALARGGPGAFEKYGAFFKAIANEPVFARVKMIAEPWDIGDGGYNVGNYPHHWREWNGQYRDTIRRFWKGDAGQVGPLATRLAGNSDLYQWDHRSPLSSINFITCHDGFTLHDLVSYKRKHNEANQENNMDGSGDNFSWNCGIEGATPNRKVRALRDRYKRGLLATLFLSQGVPMLCGGDEFGRSQSGNNNTYCQDNELNWFAWDWSEEQKRFLEFVRGLIRLRKEHRALRRSDFFLGRPVGGAAVKDITWFSATGREMSEADWRNGRHHSLGMRIVGSDETLLLLFNAWHKGISFILPAHAGRTRWELLVNTAEIEFPPPGHILHGGNPINLENYAVAVLRLSRLGHAPPEKVK